MDNKKIIIGGRCYEVLSMKEYMDNKNIFNSNYTAIEMNNYVLPVVSKSMINESIGVVIPNEMSPVVQCNYPNDAELEEYSKEKIIDYSKAKNVKELMKMQDTVRSIENEILVSKDNILSLAISEKDTPEMKAFKEAINSKQIDFKKYEPRLGKNFPNDKRALNDYKITLPKIKRIGKALDMKCTITITDASTDVPNPIGKIITVDLTDTDFDEE